MGYAAIAVLAWRAIDHDRFSEGLGRLRGTDVLLILGVALLHIAGRALRYHWLVLRSRPGRGYRWMDGVRIFLVGLSSSAVTPARAGDLIKAQLVRRYGISPQAGLGLVMVERMLDLLVIVASIVVTGLWLSGSAESDAWRGAAVVLLLALIAGVVALSAKRIRRPILGGLARIVTGIRKRHDRATVLVASLEEAFHVWDTIFVSPARLARYVVYSATVWGVEFMKLWLVLRLIHVPVDTSIALFVYPVSIVAGILSIVPFSEGVVGVTGVALLVKLAGVDPGLATVGVVVDRAASSLPPLLLWALFAAFGGAKQPPPDERSSPH